MGRETIMSQQEFEPRSEQAEYQRARRQHGTPKDEPAGSYENNASYQAQPRSQVPWWARPQAQAGQSTMRFVAIMLVLFLIVGLLGGLGVIGVILGALAHLLGVILAAIFFLLLFVFLFVMLIVLAIARALGRAFGPPRFYRGPGRRRWD
jgi:hypothetical protein